MAMAYNGKILFVDLSAKSTEEKTLPESIYRDFIGGQGLGARILYEHMKPKADPLGPDNILGFAIGPLTGTGVHGARYQVVGKSPITGGWGDSNCGGSFAIELKAAGYDAVFFTGVSEKPVYVFLNDGKVEFNDAGHIWGKDTAHTDKAIKEELKDDKVRVSCIGPAGEAQSYIAAILHEECAAARSGLAAVMGSKKLKAFVVRGTNKVPVADSENLSEVRKEYLQGIKETEDEMAVALKDYGTCGVFSASLVVADTPIKNWTRFGEEGFPTHEKLDGPAIVEYQTKKHACVGCPIRCKGYLRIDDSPYGAFTSAKIEYETLGMTGSNLLIDDVLSLFKANDLCNRYGLDTISTGAVIGFAMELYERGIINKNDTDGIELTWGNGEALVAIVEKIGKREGFGAVLADGSKFAAERIGKGSEEYAMQVGGQDLPAHDPRVLLGTAWTYILDATPARHTASEAANGFFSGADVMPYDELDMPHVEDVLDVKANAPLYAVCSDIERLFSSAGICQFSYYPGTLPIVDFINAAAGWDLTPKEALKIGRRIATLRQAFNIREGVNTAEWRLPERIAAPHSSGPNAGVKVDFEGIKREGYKALGWDSETGKPLDSTLDELGLKELVGSL
ncbi:MAG: aldehyde ferredoxin oxidoreductase family protein [Spirochaetota bacterium]|nr:MAG: aldehyde ferredoxin oxidoreductase family protein [Spirochaetota bacterium]